MRREDIAFRCKNVPTVPGCSNGDWSPFRTFVGAAITAFAIGGEGGADEVLEMFDEVLDGHRGHARPRPRPPRASSRWAGRRSGGRTSTRTDALAPIWCQQRPPRSSPGGRLRWSEDCAPNWTVLEKISAGRREDAPSQRSSRKASAGGIPEGSRSVTCPTHYARSHSAPRFQPWQ
jgi:hypothetical protein